MMEERMRYSQQIKMSTGDIRSQNEKVLSLLQRLKFVIIISIQRYKLDSRGTKESPNVD